MKRQRSDHSDLGCNLVIVMTWLFQGTCLERKGQEPKRATSWHTKCPGEKQMTYTASFASYSVD